MPVGVQQAWGPAVIARSSSGSGSSSSSSSSSSHPLLQPGDELYRVGTSSVLPATHQLSLLWLRRACKSAQQQQHRPRVLLGFLCQIDAERERRMQGQSQLQLQLWRLTGAGRMVALTRTNPKLAIGSTALRTLLLLQPPAKA